MHQAIRALFVAAGLLIAQGASATTYKDYYLHGNSCISTTGGPPVAPFYIGQPIVLPSYSQYGVNASGISSINVTCPIMLPLIFSGYTYAWFMVSGYNRSSTDHLSCTLTATGGDGSNPISATASLQSNLAASQVMSAAITPTPNSQFMYVTCHLPAQTSSGYSHLTWIWLEVGY